MPRHNDCINIQQFYDENKEEHKEIKDELKGTKEEIKTLNTQINNHVSTIASDMGLMRVSLTKIDSKYTNIKWLIALLTTAILGAIVVNLLF